MAEDTLTKDDIEKLRDLHNLRANMQLFSQNPDDEDARAAFLSAYDSLLENDRRREQISDAIKEYIIKQVTADDFNYFQFKTSTQKEDKKLRGTANKSNAQNSEAAALIKQIKEEFAFKAREKHEFQGLEDAEITSVSLKDRKLTVNVKNRREPLSFSLLPYKKELISPLKWAVVVSKKPQKSGLTSKFITLLQKCGEQGYTIQELEKPENLGKKYSPADYRKFLGLPRSAELSERQKKELTFLNNLTQTDQNSFLFALKKRTVLLKKYREIADFALNTKDYLDLLRNPEKLQNLLKKNELEDFSAAMQKNFVHNLAKDKNLWSSFSKKSEENSQRFSQYEILQNNLISRNRDVFAQAYEGDFAENSTIRRNISRCFTAIRHLATPNLPDELCAEIIAQGIFSEAVAKNTDAEKLSKMNLLLNEMGINIDFKSLPVSKCPTDAIATAAEQNKIDRQNFENLKRTAEYLKEENAFAAELKNSGIDKTSESSTHHYFALKYNAFVEPELNDNRFLIKTARANAWNYDGHDTTHLFDTAGEFLIKNEDGEYSLADFNRLRNRFKQGEKMEIQAPILQIQTASDAYQDLLALGENGKSGHYISANSTTPIFKIPAYCREGFIRNFKLKLEEKIGKKKSAQT